MSLTDECKHMTIDLDRLIYASVLLTPVGPNPVCHTTIKVYLWYSGAGITPRNIVFYATTVICHSDIWLLKLEGGVLYFTDKNISNHPGVFRGIYTG